MAGTEVNEALVNVLNSSNVDMKISEFARRLVKGTVEHRKELDGIIEKKLRKWDFARVAPVDRNIMRYAVFELLYCPDVPSKVVINEAIEISKKYSDQESGKFINGVLDSIRTENKITR